MSKKIGIITLYYHNYNYGGVLQAFALQKTLDDFNGYTAEQICYNSMGEKLPVWDRISRFVLRGSIKKTISKIRRKKSYSYRLEESNVRAIEKFANACIPHSEEVYNNRSFNRTDNIYDVFVCGSDQIWNPIALRNAYLLQGITKPKISYAASIAARKLYNPEIVRYKKSLRHFKNISVREKSSRPQIVKMTGKEVFVAADPVLLIRPEEWQRLLDDRIIKEEYVFVYFLGSISDAAKSFITELKNQGKTIINIAGLAGDENCRGVTDCGPLEFLNYILNADMILTDSFHAMVFSTLFRKRFIVFDRSGSVTDMSERISDFIDMTGLQCGLDTNRMHSIEDYDFAAAHQHIDAQRQASFDYLKDALYD